MLMIGKCNEVFWLCNDKIPDLLSAQTKKQYILAKKNILLRYSRYKNSGAPMLKIAIETDLVPNPKKYLNNAMRPTNRMILLKKETLKHEFYTNSLNIKKCEICLECHIEDKQLKEGETTYICQKCQNRKDQSTFLRTICTQFGMRLMITDSSSRIKMAIRYLILNAQLS
jgi:hypothetical protein